MAEYTIEVINGDVGDAMDRAQIVTEESGVLYTVVRYRDFAEIVESKAKYINKVRDNRAIQEQAKDGILISKIKKLVNDCDMGVISCGQLFLQIQDLIKGE